MSGILTTHMISLAFPFPKEIPSSKDNPAPECNKVKRNKINIPPTRVTVTASSLTAGTAVIENVSTGKTVTHTFSNEASEGSLCEYNAEWIVEDYESGSSLVKFADFGTVTFTGCSATDGSGTVGTTGATVIDIEQNGKVLTDCSVPSSSEVSCTYV